MVNNDWGKGAADVFGKMLKEKGVAIGAVETMDASAQDLNAQLSKIKSSDADTLFVTTAVEQLTLVLKQVQALGLKRQIITTGGSQSPDQLIEQAGAAANGSYHLLFFPPWAPEATPDAAAAKAFVAEWRKRGYTFAGLTEGFRGYDGIQTIAAAIRKAGKAEPEAIRAALVGDPADRPQRQDRIHESRTCGQGKRPEHRRRIRGEDRQRQSESGEVSFALTTKVRGFAPRTFFCVRHGIASSPYAPRNDIYQVIARNAVTTRSRGAR